MHRAPPIQDRPSPNFGPRRAAAAPDMVILHYTAMETAEAALARLADPAAEVSAHYVITEAGGILRMVDEEMRAWHAGAGAWGAVADVNSHSIGIELVNPGPELGDPPYPHPQIAALEALLADILARRAIAPERVVGHACIAPRRKRDPGRKLDWRRLALGGLAVWLDPPAPDGLPPDAPADAARFQAAARRFGYDVPGGGDWCAGTLAVWRAFALRFLPARAEAPPDAAGVAHLEALAARWPVDPPADAGA